MRGGISGFRRRRMKTVEIMEHVWKAVMTGRIKVHVNLHGYIQLIDVKTGKKVVIGNIGGDDG